MGVAADGPCIQTIHRAPPPVGRLETTVQLVGATELPVLDPLGTTGYDMHVPEYRAVDEANHSEVEAPQLACFWLFDASDQATQTLISFPPCCFVAAGVAAADMMVSELTAAKCILCSQVSGTSGYCVATPPCASPTSSFSTGPLTVQRRYAA